MILDGGRIAPDQVVGEFVDAGLHRLRPTLDHRLAPARDALVRLDFHEQPARRNEEGLQVGDLQFGPYLLVVSAIDKLAVVYKPRMLMLDLLGVQSHRGGSVSTRRMQRNPMWLMPLSIIWAWRAAGRYRRQ